MSAYDDQYEPISTEYRSEEFYSIAWEYQSVSPHADINLTSTNKIRKRGIKVSKDGWLYKQPSAVTSEVEWDFAPPVGGSLYSLYLYLWREVSVKLIFMGYDATEKKWEKIKDLADYHLPDTKYTQFVFYNFDIAKYTKFKLVFIDGDDKANISIAQIAFVAQVDYTDPDFSFNIDHEMPFSQNTLIRNIPNITTPITLWVEKETEDTLKDTYFHEILVNHIDMEMDIENDFMVFFKDYCPRSLQNDKNKPFFAWVEKIVKIIQKDRDMALVLLSQFTIDTASKQWMNNLGRFLGIARPPLAFTRTTKPIITYPSNDAVNLPESFNATHGYSSLEDTPDAVKGTYFGDVNFVSEALAGDGDYFDFIRGMLQIREGITLPAVYKSFLAILTKPFYISQHNAQKTVVNIDITDDAARQYIAEELARKLSQTGLYIKTSRTAGLDTWGYNYIGYDNSALSRTAKPSEIIYFKEN